MTLNAAKLTKSIKKTEWHIAYQLPVRGSNTDQWKVVYPDLDDYTEFHTSESLDQLAAVGLGEWEDRGEIDERDSDVYCLLCQNLDPGGSVIVVPWANA